MTRLSRVLLRLSFAATLWGFPTAMHAQISSDDISHLPLPNAATQGSLAARLAKRLQLSQQRTFDQDLLNKLLKRTQAQPDPNTLQDLLQEHPELRDPEQLKRLQQLLGKYVEGLGGAGLPSLPPGQGSLPWEQLQQQLGQLNPETPLNPPQLPQNASPQTRPTPATQPSQTSEPTPPEVIPQPSEPDTTLTTDPQQPINPAVRQEQLENQLERWFGKIEDKSQLRDAVEQLTSDESLFGNGQDWGEWIGDWSQWEQEAFHFQEWLTTQASSVEDWDLVGLDDLGVNLGLPSLGGSVDIPGLGGGSLTMIPDSSALLGIILVIIGLGTLVVIGYWVQQQQNEAKRAEQARLRDWRIDPSQVHSKEDLIQAFEYLALSKLGLEARVWNHRLLAVHFTDLAPQCRREADELAELYAQARYAPTQTTLGANAIQLARSHLATLQAAPAHGALDA